MQIKYTKTHGALSKTGILLKKQEKEVWLWIWAECVE